MIINGKVHLFFEQSGTFKQEFIKLGIPAEDYDIQNNFGQTDHVVDLFGEIEKAYRGGVSAWDSISCNDLVIAFFPCIYFSACSQMNFSFSAHNNRHHTHKERADKALKRSENRERYFRLAIQMISCAEQRGLRLIMENPWNEQTFLKNNFIYPPTIVDNNRSLRGDYFRKPTAYWFINCTPTHGKSYQPRKPNPILSIAPTGPAGICNEERSMISPDYARNFICDFILGQKQEHSELDLFG